MGKEVNFTPIELQKWKRGQIFYYFSKVAPTGYSVTVELDVTRMRTALRAAGLKFFPAYLWLVTKNLNEQQEFRMAEKDGQIGYYATLTPLYATFHEDDKTFSLMWTEYEENFMTFYHSYLRNQAQCGKNHGILAQTGQLPPPNAYTVSCIPWISFQHFAVHNYDNKPYYFPSVEAGKYYEKDGRIRLPLSITCHHATTDGYHVNLFLEKLQEEMNQFEEYVSLR